VEQRTLVVVAAKLSVIPPSGSLEGKENVSTLTPPLRPLKPFNETLLGVKVIPSTEIPSALTLRLFAEMSHSKDSSVNKV